MSGVGFSGELRPNQHMYNLQQLIRMGDEEYQRLKSYAESKRNEIQHFFQFAGPLPTVLTPSIRG
jgi:hypothetical protein